MRPVRNLSQLCKELPGFYQTILQRGLVPGLRRNHKRRDIHHIKGLIGHVNPVSAMETVGRDRGA